MSSEQITTSVAIYFKSEQGRSIPLRWFEEARNLFAERNLTPVLFTAEGGDFRLDDCYVLADHGNRLTIFGEVIESRGVELMDALQSGEIVSLGLDSPCSGAENREDWRANVSAFLTSGECYIGIDERLAPDISALLRRAYSMAEGLFDVGYGIAYKLPLSQYPDGYASGFRGDSFSDVREMIHHRREWEHRKETPDELWRAELLGKRRHLTGFFRGAYPASVLSESHLKMAGLRSHTIGRLSELGQSLWLWELSDSELPLAEKLLETKGVLLSARHC